MSEPTRGTSRAREIYNLNPDWRVAVGDVDDAQALEVDETEWEQISLPHAWNEDEAFREDIYGLSTDIAWYRKTFTLPDNAAEKKVFVEFEGVRQAAEVYCNGEFLGHHENGVMAFGFDLSELVESGENVLAVRVDNDWEYEEMSTGESYQWADHNFNANYGGITKNVKLHVTDRLYQTLLLYSWLGTTGVYVYADGIDVDTGTATINAESEIRNEHPRGRSVGYEVEVRDPDGETITEFDGNERLVPPGATVVRPTYRSIESTPRTWTITCSKPAASIGYRSIRCSPRTSRDVPYCSTNRPTRPSTVSSNTVQIPRTSRDTPLSERPTSRVESRAEIS